MRDWKKEVESRLRELAMAPARQHEIVEELSQHLRDRYEEVRACGVEASEAEGAVMRELDARNLADEIRRIEQPYRAPAQLGAAAGGGSFRSMLQDVRYGTRVLKTNPGFTAVCIISLALGIGANTAIFQLLNAVRMRTLPVPHAQELAILRFAPPVEIAGRATGRFSTFTFAIWSQIKDKQQAFSDIAAFGSASFNLSNGGEMRIARGMYVSGDFFQTLQAPASMGRVFTAADDKPGCGAESAVISYSFWQREFGAARDVIGRKVSLDGQPFTVVGVTPQSFYGVEVGRVYDVAIPMCTEPIMNGENAMTPMKRGWWLAAFGRLKPGWTLEKATAHLNALSPGILEATLPPEFSGTLRQGYLKNRLQAITGAHGYSWIRSQYETPLILLLAVAGMVLLIACANLANLMLARASVREREIAVRLALGASRARLVYQLLTEGMLLAIAGAVLGGILAWNLSAFLVAFLSTESSRIYLERAVDWRLLGFTGLLACVTCVLFSLAPSLKATKMAPAQVMNSGGRGVTTNRERFGFRRALAVAQIAMSLVLFVGALLFVRTLRNLLELDAGFQRTGILVAQTDFTRLHVPGQQRVRFREQLLEQIRAIPGVESAAETMIVPLSGSGWNNNVVVNGVRQQPNVNMTNVSAQYFNTMSIPMLSGRDFGPSDTAQSPKVAIVNQEFARKLLGGADPIGKTFHIDGYIGDHNPEFQIVGVVKNTKYYDLRENDDPMAYYPQSQEEKPDPSTAMVIRSELPMSTLMSEVKEAIGKVNGGVDLYFSVLNKDIKEGLLRERLLATLSGAFALLAGVLATVGLYGVIAYMVVRRTNEIGVRIALGAQRSSILRMIVREATRLLGLGVAAGVVLAIVAMRSATTLLYGLKPWDPITLVFAAALLAAVTIGASLLPANRAAHLDPMSALREQ